VGRGQSSETLLEEEKITNKIKTSLLFTLSREKEEVEVDT